jgi:hypothetical protein
MSISILEAKLHMTLDKLSNGEPVHCDEQWIEDAGELFKEGLRKQLHREPEAFRLRMSNIGRPACQLQMEKAGEERSKMPYNHIMRMMLGDAVEAIVEVLLRVSGANITGGKSQAEYHIAGTVIKGENDIEIDGKTYDTKSASPWAFDNKWQDGWHGVAKDDAFGYCAQLLGYTRGTDTDMGGWIVVNKSTGEIRVVEATPTPQELKDLEKSIENRIKLVEADGEFERCFEPVNEYFRGKPTGSKRLHTTCTFCSYTNKCWPDAEYKPQTGSKAASPRHFWYAEYNDDYV